MMDFQWLIKVLKKKYPIDVNRIIEAANLVVEQKFVFDMEWDMEQTHEIVHFPDRIDWQYQGGDDPEWTYALNRHRFLIYLGKAYRLTRLEIYRQTWINHFMSWYESVPVTEENKGICWRSIEAGLRMNYWLESWQLIDGESMPRDVKDAFCKSLHEHCDYIRNVDRPFSKISNWGLLENQGLAIASLFLGRDKDLDLALDRITKGLQLQLFPDGVHWEQSPMYHNEILRYAMDVIRKLREANKVVPLKLLDLTKKMAEVNLYWVKPNREQYKQGDSDGFNLKGLLIYSAILFSDGRYKYLGGDLDAGNLWAFGRMGYELYEALEENPHISHSFGLIDSGNFFMRSGLDCEANAIRFSCGYLGGGHGHLEKLHFQLIAGGRDLLIDTGRYTYRDCPERYVLKGAKGHNTIILDDSPFCQMKDVWGVESIATPVNTRFITSKIYDYVQGGHLGYMKKGWYIERRLLFIKPNIVIQMDYCLGEGKTQMKSFYHFSKEGLVSETSEGYQYKNNNVLSYLIPVDYDFIHVGESIHSDYYNQLGQHTRLDCIQTIDGQGIQAKVWILNSDKAFKVRKLEVKSFGDTNAHSSDSLSGLEVEYSGKKYQVYMAFEEMWSNLNSVNMDGKQLAGQVVLCIDEEVVRII